MSEGTGVERLEVTGPRGSITDVETENIFLSPYAKLSLPCTGSRTCSGGRKLRDTGAGWS